MSENGHMALEFPIKELRYYFHPVYPGEQVTIVAESHNYKSGFIDFWAATAAKELARMDDRRAIIVKINTEDAIETLITNELARNGAGNLDKLSEGKIENAEEYLRAEVIAGSLPIVHIGESLGMDDSNAAQLYLSNIIRLIDYARKSYFAEEVQIAAIFIDYIQALPFDPEVRRNGNMEISRRLQVMQDEDRIRRGAKYFKCPVIVAAQSRELPEKKTALKMPDFYDCQETTYVPQHTDRMYALAMPKRSVNVGSLMEIGGITFNVTESQLWIKCHKQKRYKNAGGSFPLLIAENGDVSLDAGLLQKIQKLEGRR
jgi:hypothetical protein